MGNNQPKGLVSPNLEWKRTLLINRMFRNLSLECEKIGIKADVNPRFARWLATQTLDFKEGEPVFSNPETLLDKNILVKELLSEIPYRVYPDRMTSDKIKQFIKRGRKILKSLENESGHSLLKTNLAKKLNKLYVSNDKELLMECYEKFQMLFANKVETICTKLYEQSLDWAAEMLVYDKQRDIDVVVEIVDGIDDDEIVIKYGQFNSIKLNKSVFYRLKGEYKCDGNSFSSYIYCCARRFQTLFNDYGNGIAASVPTTVLKYWQESLGCDHECFASPFNHVLPKYCSAFKDVDQCFGSYGSFYDFWPSDGGSFEVNPPYTVEHLEKSVRHVVKLCKAISSPLSFIIIYPNWENFELPTSQLIKSDKIARKHILLNGGEHKFIVGTQHLKDHFNESWTALHSTIVSFIQNDAGAEKWPVTPEIIAETVRLFA